MWPWGHAAVGYLLYRAGVATGVVDGTGGDRGPVPAGPATLALGVGTQFPDLVDKPLAWSFGLLPSGRTLAHSLFTAAVVIAVVGVVARRYGTDAPPVARAFGVGYLSHLLADVPPGIAFGESLATAGYLAWPVVPAAAYAGQESFAAQLPPEATPFQAVQVALFAAAVLLWARDGSPGLSTLARLVGRPVEG